MMSPVKNRIRTNRPFEMGATVPGKQGMRPHSPLVCSLPRPRKPTVCQTRHRRPHWQSRHCSAHHSRLWMPTARELTKRQLGRISLSDIYPQASIRSDEERAIRDYSPHERDSVTAKEVAESHHVHCESPENSSEIAVNAKEFIRHFNTQNTYKFGSTTPIDRNRHTISSLDPYTPRSLIMN